jgi:hypothetical protein
MSFFVGVEASWDSCCVVFDKSIDQFKFRRINIADGDSARVVCDAVPDHVA